MRCSIAITTLLCLPALISAWSDSLYVRHADPDTDLYGTSLYARDASPYEGLDTSGAYHVKRAVEARYAKAEALAEAYAEAVDNAHELFSRAASAFPEAFPYPGKFKVPKDKAACTALRSKLTKEYHAKEEEFGKLKAAYKGDDSKKAAELEALTNAVATGRKRAKKVAIEEGCEADSGHDHEIATWEANSLAWKRKKDAAKAKGK